MVAISVKNVSKKFKINQGKEETLKGLVVRLLKGNLPKTDEFWALKNVSFEVNRGETFGIIGGNGSGKTTLLRVLAGILFPNSGEVKVSDKISTLFELGTGFHPELTGRENVYLNGSILGLSKKEIDEKFNEILAFSELEKFIDTPLKHYSSGMQVRLAFSVAIHVNPEVLLVDEVLAVGDAAFQGKSFNMFKEFKKKGVTIVFVSHDIASVQEFCDRVLIMQKGTPYFIGKPEKAVLEYLRLNLTEQGNKSAVSQKKLGKVKKDLRITRVSFLDETGKEDDVFQTGKPLTIRVFFQAEKKIDHPVVGLAIISENNVNLTGPNTRDVKYVIDSVNGEGYIDYVVEKDPLLAGKYFVTVGLFNDAVSFSYDYVEKAASFRILPTEINQAGLIKLDAHWNLGKKE